MLFALLFLTAAAPDPLADLAKPAQSAWQDIRAQIVAHVETTIGAPMAGRLIEFPFHDGDRFPAGAVLAKFHCNEQNAVLARARAILQEKREVLATASKLNKLGTSSGLEYRIAIAQVDEATADVEGATAAVDNCTVRAPFAGRAGTTAARPFQSVGLGAPLLDILDDGTLELELLVPSKWIVWLAPGRKFVLQVDETAKSYEATLTRIAGRVDPVSQSVKIYAQLTPGLTDLHPGMSGRALLTPPEAGAK